ncbi:contractile injection system protein, VgrG/Pvc8 family [Marinisporobacter balticus]|uniref:Late control gene D protein (GPD) n=1 Tax=Marinisporobacter balticus TaxID=2018667 RepID=A0A4R2KCJ5_9FIRM|nr:contractile injection system protein, VgrG/Pvc8 family [Marinisporobacter balticus]TCO67909.1 late control gene D protein (GPD) [Marinisporobacter balticus]
MKRGLSYQNLTIDLPVKLQKITKLKIEQSLNNHAVAHITGILEETEKLDAIYKLNIETNIKIKSKAEDGEKIIFSGVPVNVSIKHTDDVYYIDLVLNSYSIYLDFKTKSRSFQNKQNPYTNIFKEVIKEYAGYVLDVATKGAKQNGAIIQYEETDWEFIKRIASHVGAKIFPEIQSNKPKIYIGMNRGNSYEERNHNYTIEKNIKDYLDFEKNYGGASEKDRIFYTVESMDDYELGDKITYQKIVFTVVQKNSALEKGILTHRYKLQKEKSIKQNILYNKKIEGVSIEGKVLAVKRDKLKLHLSIDPTQSEELANWYQFDTSYTSEGTTGVDSQIKVAKILGLNGYTIG